MLLGEAVELGLFLLDLQHNRMALMVLGAGQKSPSLSKRVSAHLEILRAWCSVLAGLGCKVSHKQP